MWCGFRQHVAGNIKAVWVKQYPVHEVSPISQSGKSGVLCVKHGVGHRPPVEQTLIPAGKAKLARSERHIHGPWMGLK